jgi:hypothetical protein
MQLGGHLITDIYDGTPGLDIYDGTINVDLFDGSLTEPELTEFAGIVNEDLYDGTITASLYGGSLTLPALDGSLAVWTMQNVPLTLAEFNDQTINLAITSLGSPFNLTGVTLNMLLKTAAGTADNLATLLSSAGGSPAIIVTNAASGLATVTIPSADLGALTYTFYRIDVVQSGLKNTCMYGAVTYITLLCTG